MAAERVILLVEDNKDDEFLTIRAMRKNGITQEIVVAHDGAEAVDYLFGQGAFAGRSVQELPQLVLLDLNLPKLSGLDVLRKIRGDARTKLIPVVVLTSSKQDEDIIDSYSNGANSYVRKPVDFKQFTEAVKVLGLYWLTINEVASPKGP